MTTSPNKMSDAIIRVYEDHDHKGRITQKNDSDRSGAPKLARVYSPLRSLYGLL